MNSEDAKIEKIELPGLQPDHFEALEKIRDGKFVCRNLSDVEISEKLCRRHLVSVISEDSRPRWKKDFKISQRGERVLDYRKRKSKQLFSVT